MLQAVLKVLGFLLAFLFLENLLRGAIAVGLTIKICDSHIYDAFGSALEETPDQDVSSLAVIDSMICKLVKIIRWE